MKLKIISATILLMTTTICQTNAQSLNETAKEKISRVESLISKVEKLGKDAWKEKMTVSTAKTFLIYADWDEQHVAENVSYFKQVPKYKDSASLLANQLAVFERLEITKMLDDAESTLKQLISGEINRKPTPKIDWTKITNDGTQLTYLGRPVFVHDYTWKPEVKELNEYHGNLDGFLLAPNQVMDDNGTIRSEVVKELKNKHSGSIGFIFLTHKGIPDWVEKKYNNFTAGNRLFTAYDIDNPGAREMQHDLLKGTVPYIAGKKHSQLGYMMANEPHWNTIANTWASGPVSDYTKDKFRVWLKATHQSISVLNKLWGTNFKSFDSIKIAIPIDQKLAGTPQWYNWMQFNMVRVTDWFTFLHDEIKKYDPAARTHLKIIPNLWSNNKRDHGLDFEKLTKLTEIIGNDAGSANTRMRGSEDWEKYYTMDWREVSMTYDFFKSISPEKIIFNTESHFLSTHAFRDLYQRPEYVRAIYWLAHMQGLVACQTWYWARNADGSISEKAGKGYAASNNQQPRVINELAATMMDLNAYSEEINSIQHQKKPLRIFYSETSAINKEKHMDDVFELYESLFFKGVPIGFATKDIILEQDNKNWEAILVHKTQFVTKNELSALQQYLNKGGTVIMDTVSLHKNEYGQPLEKLKAGTGKLIYENSVSEMKEMAFNLLAKKSLLPELEITETNAAAKNGCAWKCIKNKEGKYILSVVNLGKTDALLSIKFRKGDAGVICKDLLTGLLRPANPVIKPYEVFFVEVNQSLNK